MKMKMKTKIRIKTQMKMIINNIKLDMKKTQNTQKNRITEI